MKTLLTMLFLLSSPQALAGLLDPYGVFKCKEGNKNFVVTLNKAPSDHTITDGSFKCSFHVTDVSHFQRGPDNRWTISYQLKSCGGIEREAAEFNPKKFMIESYMTFNFRPTDVITVAQILNEGNGTSCFGSIKESSMKKLGAKK